MEKINISEEEFNDVLNDVFNTFYEFNDNNYKSLEEALKKHIFNVPLFPFNKDDWNSCNVKPTKEFYDSYFVMRSKDGSFFEDYILCAYNEYSDKFYNQEDDDPLEGKDPSNFEYKLFEE